MSPPTIPAREGGERCNDDFDFEEGSLTVRWNGADCGKNEDEEVRAEGEADEAGCEGLRIGMWRMTSKRSRDAIRSFNVVGVEDDTGTEPNDAATADAAADADVGD